MTWPRTAPARIRIVTADTELDVTGHITAAYADDDIPDTIDLTTPRTETTTTIEFTTGISPDIYELLTGQPWPTQPLYRRVWHRILHHWRNMGGAG